jgi:elongation factor 1-beta
VEKSKSNAAENAESSVACINVQSAVSQDHKADEVMGSVIVTYKVFPDDVMDSFDDLKKKIEKCLPEFASMEGYGEEPIAFGLKALLVQVKFPEDKTGLVDEFETELGKIEHVSQVQTLMVRRSSR